MRTIVYAPKVYSQLKRQQLLTLAYALEDMRDRAIKQAETAEKRLAELPDEIRGMCYWLQGVKRFETETHRTSHYGYVCPYEAMAQVIEGKPDPRRAALGGTE